MDSWLRNSGNNFKFKNYSFVATVVIRNCDKEEYTYYGYGITFNTAGYGVLSMALIGILYF